MPKPRHRRTIQEQIADLQAQIAAIKAREAQKKAKADPALRHAGRALREIDKAIAGGAGGRTRDALLEARAWLSQALDGAAGPSDQARLRPRTNDLDEVLLVHLRANPGGQRAEEIASALATDSATLRPAMKRLIAAGKVRSEGQKRATTYAAV